MLSRERRAVTLALVTLVLLVAFEAYAVVTAMPVAARELTHGDPGTAGEGARTYGLVFSLFLTTSLIGIVVAGEWNDRRGSAGPMLTGMVIFCSGLIICGLAGTMSTLLVGRAIGGLGAGLQMVTTYVVVGGLYPERLQPVAFSVISGTWVVAAVVGPPLAGLLATEVSWRAAFLAVPPLALVAGPVLRPRLRQVPRPASPAHGRPLGVLALRAAGLAGGATLAQVATHLDAVWPARAAMVAAGLLAVGLALPGLVPTGVFRLGHGLPSLVVVRALINAAFFGSEVFVPLMLVDHRGVPPALAGTVLTAAAAGWFTGAWLQGRTRWGSWPVERTALLTGGSILLGAGVAGLLTVTRPGVPVQVAVPVWALAGLGMGLAFSSASVLLLRLADPGAQGRAASALQIGDSLGSVTGMGVAGALYAALHRASPPGADTRTFAVIWVALAGAAVVAAVASRRVGGAPLPHP